MDRQIAEIGRQVAADPAVRDRIPDWRALMEKVLADLEARTVEVEVELLDGQRARVSVGRFALAFITSRSLSGPDEFAILPALYHSLSAGNPGLLTKIVQRIVRRPPPSPLRYVMDGAAGISTERQARIESEAQRSLLGNAVNFPFPEIQSAWGYEDLGPSYRAPVRAQTSVLFITGELDGNTPPQQAEEVWRGFANGEHLVLRNGGHGSAFSSADAVAVMVEFLAGGTSRGREIAMPAPRLVPLNP